jgi:hypothetical protein
MEAIYSPETLKIIEHSSWLHNTETQSTFDCRENLKCQVTVHNEALLLRRMPASSRNLLILINTLPSIPQYTTPSK